MSVVFDASAAVLQRAGIRRYAAELAARLVRGRHASRLALVSAGWGGPAGAEAPSGWIAPATVRRLDPDPRRHRLRLLTRVMLRWPDDGYWGGPRLLHSPDAFAPPLRHGATILTLHDLSFRRFPECHTASNRRFLEAVVGRSARRAAIVLADSQATRRDAIEELGLPPDRVRVVHPGLAAAFSPRDPGECRARAAARFGLERGFVLTVGTIEPRKNHAFLLEAFARLSAGHGYPGDLAIAGLPGWGSVRLEPLAARLRLGPRLRLLGGVSDQDLHALYGACDVFALPSLYEGFGLPPLEALACGAPVVVSDRGALPEVVGTAGAVVPLGDPERWARALATAMAPESRLAARGEGPRQAARFSWDVTAAAVEALYDELLTG